MTKSRAERQEQRRKKARIKQRNRLIRTVFFLAVVILGVTYLTIQSGKTAEPLVSPEIIAEGKQIYEATCISCHGEQGEGHIALAQAPALNGNEHSWHHPDGQIQTLIQDGGVSMPPFRDSLENDEIFAVLRYVQTWWSADQLNSQQRASQSNPFRGND